MVIKQAFQSLQGKPPEPEHCKPREATQVKAEAISF